MRYQEIFSSVLQDHISTYPETEAHWLGRYREQHPDLQTAVKFGPQGMARFYTTPLMSLLGWGDYELGSVTLSRVGLEGLITKTKRSSAVVDPNKFAAFYGRDIGGNNTVNNLGVTLGTSWIIGDEVPGLYIAWDPSIGGIEISLQGLSLLRDALDQ